MKQGIKIYKFYHSHPSQPSNSLKSLFYQAGAIEINEQNQINQKAPFYFSEQLIDIYKIEHKSKEYKQICPDGVVPFVIEFQDQEAYDLQINGRPLLESASILRYLCRSHSDISKYYALEKGQDPNFDIRQNIDEFIDFNGTLVRPTYQGAFTPLLTKRFKKQQKFTQNQLDSMKDSYQRSIPYMFKKLERRIQIHNKDGVYLTRLKCLETNSNIPSIADIQLFWEFNNFKYFKYGELDHLLSDWEAKHPRLALWYNTILQSQSLSDSKHNQGLRKVYQQWYTNLKDMQEKLYCEDFPEFKMCCL